MRLLIVTQAVDQNDSYLGFFVRWLQEFSKHCEEIEVICLRMGEHTLPQNIHIHQLRSANKLGRSFEFLYLSTTLTYDTVFVHMNPEYLVVAGWLWRLLGKKIAFWYTHKSVNVRLRLAVLFANIVFTASRKSFRLKSDKVRVMGHGIDTDFFSPDPSINRGDWILSAGRLMRSKRHDLAIAEAVREGRELRIVGEGPERSHLEALANEMGAHVQFLGGLTQVRLRDEYRKAAYLIHTSETGSLDKVVLEALACGLPVKTNDHALKMLENEDSQYVREHHSLSALIPRILATLA